MVGVSDQLEGIYWWIVTTAKLGVDLSISDLSGHSHITIAMAQHETRLTRRTEKQTNLSLLCTFGRKLISGPDKVQHIEC